MKYLFAAFLFPALALAGAVSTTVTVSPAELQFGRHAGYDLVQMDRGVTLARPGEPALPELPVTCVLPAGARLTGVKVEPLAWSELPGTFRICPAQEPRPISSKAPVAWREPDPTAHALSTWPEALHREATPGNAGGFALAAVTIAPLRWSPASGRLELCTSLRVTFTYEPGAAARAHTPAQGAAIESSLRGLVTNPADLERFAPPRAATDLPEVNCLVVTADRLAAEFAAYCDWRTARGIRTEVRTVEWVECNYTGRDLQEKLRNCIREFQERRGLAYVILAGDNALVPGRRIHVSVGGERGEIPTDLYYADLDWSWDSDGDNRFGEMSDSVDFYADVLVGRASVENAAEARSFFAKVRSYEEDPDPGYIKRSLLPSGWLWRDMGYHGSFVNDSIANFTPTGWQDVELINPPNAAVVAESIESGFAVFDPAGHGNEQGVYDADGTPIYTSSYARGQRNARRYNIMTSLACTPGNFEYEDCIAELAHNCAGGGSIAVMMNSRYGWGTPPYFGPSEKLCARFFDFLFARGQTGLGACHSRSREEYAGIALYDQLWRWCMTEFNLFGDPCIDIWTEPPSSTLIGAPDSIYTGSRNLAVNVTSGGNPVPGALVCAFKEGEVYATGRTNPSGTVELAVRPATPGELRLTASAHDFLPSSRSVPVGPGVSTPHIAFVRAAIDDAGQPNANGILEPGETGRLTVVLRNTGTSTATATRLTLEPLTSGISLSDTSTDVGAIGAGDSAVVAAGDVTASPGVLPGSTAEIDARAYTLEGDWEFGIGIRLGFPGRTVVDLDTGAVALSVTARGTLGWDRESARPGRGFRFPKTDTSCLRTASFALAGCASYIADRFYNTTNGCDTDWRLADSIRARSPLWNSDEYYTAAFNDAGHPGSHDVTVYQRALGASESGADDWVVLVYDICNGGDELINGYAGIFADFDVVATDRFHDLAGTDPALGTAWMRSIQAIDRWCGVKLLDADGAARLACIDHARYVNPDSGLTDNMKFRLLSGGLGSASSDRPYDWSVVVAAGPLSLPSGGRQRVAFALVAAPDSAAYFDACRRAQDWYDANVGVQEHTPRNAQRPTPNATVARGVLYLPGSSFGLRHSTLVDASGRQVLDLRSGPNDVSHLPAGVYFVRSAAPVGAVIRAVRLVR
ncbi:MAG: C25 family cysteine peptidase [bacterium]